MRQSGKRWFAGAAVLTAASAALAAGVLVEDYGKATVFGIRTSGVHDLEDSYSVGNLDCIAELDPPSAIEVPGTVGNFFNQLLAGFPDPPWSYATAVTPLSAGALSVKTYDAIGTPTRVGAEFHVHYTPGVGDPADIHWIQVVTDNHALTGAHGTPENQVDADPGASTPFYEEDNGAADDTDFFDRPSRTDAGNDHTWQADLFVTTGPAIGAGPGLVTLYTPGIHWGWKNTCTVKPPPPQPRYACTPDSGIALLSDGPIVPGADLTATVELPASIDLTKDPTSVTVALTGASLSVHIDEQVVGHVSEFTVTGGSGSFAPYLFGAVPVGVSSVEIVRGHGAILWPSGEVSLHLEVRVSAAGFDDIRAVADGTGIIDFGLGRVSVDPSSTAIETSVSIPSLPAPALLALAALLLGAAVAMASRGRVAMRRI